MTHASKNSSVAPVSPVLPMRLILVVLISLLLTPHCLAQTTAPAALPPAVEGAYEHDPVVHQGSAQAMPSNGKSAATQNLSTSPLDGRRVVLSLGIVLALVFICRWAARWMFPSTGVGRSSQVMTVLSRSVIAPKQQLLLIQVGRRLVLVGDCGQQMNALAEISDPDEVASLLGKLRADPVDQPVKRFDPLLGRARQQFDDLPPPPAVDPEEEEDELAMAGIDETRGELSGLTEKIRMLSRQLGKM